MQRLLQNAPATITATISLDGVDTDPAPDSATVRVVAADGTELVATTAATPSGTGEFSLTLPPAQTAKLDLLTAYWTFTITGQTTTLTTRHEIVGGFFFTLNEALAALPGTPVEELLAARSWAEDELERACGTAFVPRYAREIRTARHGRLRLPRANIRTIRAVIADGLAFTAPQLTALQIIAGELQGVWWPRRAAVTIDYEHGLDTPPQAIHDAALALVTDRLRDESGIDPRAESIITEDGTIRLATAGAEFGIPTVDRAVRAHREPLVA
jgi:hypothetical protein